MQPRGLGYWIYLVLSTAALAQSDRGSIAGSVLDGREPVGGAPIEARNTASGIIYKTASSRSGEYSISSLPPGKYQVSISVAGFEKKEATVLASQTTTIDFAFRADFQLGTLGDGDVYSQIARLRPPAAAGGPAPRTPDGKPDLSGVWRGPRTESSDEPDLLPAAEKALNDRFAMNNADSPAARCMPDAILRLTPIFKIVQSPTVLVLMIENETPGYYQVFLDGRGHPKEPNPTWYGHAIGKWDGDTLVVDTVGFNDRRWLTVYGTPISEKLHITERFRRSDLNHLEIETTIDDAGVYPKPWKMKRVSELAPEEEIMESICNENNKDPQHMVGK